MKPVHIAMIAAAAAYLYYITSQRKNVSFTPDLSPMDNPVGGPMEGPGAWDGFVYPSRPYVPTPKYAYETGFVAPKFPHTPTPSYAYSDGGWTVGGYQSGMNWPARDNIFG